MRLAPRLPPARLRLASAEAAGGDYAAAAESYAAVLAAAPGHRAARMAQATCLILTGRDADAAASLEAGLKELPDDPYLSYQLALLRAASATAAVRDGAAAVELARTAFGALSTPVQAQAVAMAHAESGDFEGAVRAQERLLAALPEDDPLRPGAASRLALYRRQQPARAPWKGDPALLYNPTVPLPSGE